MLNTRLRKVLRTTGQHFKKLELLGLNTIKDLMFYFPRGYTDNRDIKRIVEMKLDEQNVVKGIIKSFFSRRTKSGKIMTRAILSDDTGSVEVIWFNQPHVQRLIPQNSEVILTGKLKYAFGKLCLISPAYETVKEEQIHTARIVPIYHETSGLTSKWLREKLKPIIDDFCRYIEDYMPEKILKKYNLVKLSEAILEIHFPEKEKKLEKAKKRLSFDELFLIQFKALKKRYEWQKISKNENKKIKINKTVLKNFIEKLPFKLTEDQKNTAREILNDMQKEYPMSRLLQGDVGSGKTIVAAIAILTTIKSGVQTAVMAPTEILAKQHYKTLSKLLAPFSINVQFISGATGKSEKKKIVNQLKTGTCDLVIGTHALIQENITFRNLGLAVIDEQHRFGVRQRSVLKSHGSPHLLSLTATPIPRTLAMTIYGDQDISEIKEMPKGRKEIITRVVPENKRKDAYIWIEDQINKGHQVYIICPLIDESDIIEVKAVNKEYENLKTKIFSQYKLGLLHGKLKQEEKDKIMEEFRENKINILVSTSVVEVGIDIPNATIMIIEGAERFGLSQLHQFRGRVGRGETQSYCFLFANNLSMEGTIRLNAMTKYTSGFKLSEIDLSLRGPGEIYGIKQSGIPDLKMASLVDYTTIKLARQAAEDLMREDPELSNYSKLKEKIAELDEPFIKD